VDTLKIMDLYLLVIEEYSITISVIYVRIRSYSVLAFFK